MADAGDFHLWFCGVSSFKSSSRYTDIETCGKSSLKDNILTSYNIITCTC